MSVPYKDVAKLGLSVVMKVFALDVYLFLSFSQLYFDM